jgi:thioredoxin-like negative regulator of GroEL
MAEVFQLLNMIEIDSQSLDEKILKDTSDQIFGLYLWGHNCPNCEVAKKMLSLEHQSVLELNLKWLHGDVYTHPELGTRFGLHGIPTFLFFKNGKKLGRISPFPGIEPFLEALLKLKKDSAS